MAGRPSTKECKVCHHRFPVNEMVAFEDYVKTGKSGVSFSLDLSKTKNKRHRAHTGRNYYSKKIVWVCKNHAKGFKTEVQERKSNRRWNILFGVLFFVFMVTVASLSEAAVLL